LPRAFRLDHTSSGVAREMAEFLSKGRQFSKWFEMRPVRQTAQSRFT